MTAAERDTQARILLALGARPDVRLFRNNVGMGWAGRLVENRNGLVILADARPLHAGLCAGSSDLIGWTTVTVTPAMVGQPVALFTAVEVKAARGRATDDQRRFIDAVVRFGGIAGLARSPDDAAALIAAGLPLSP